jgi:bifunctional non-homologous end joining protein LigD
MGLERYREKRDFSRTPEPPAKAARKQKFSYVVQKHAARNLHYDFRLELDGVLLSWAVPKGPSLDPAVKRLAMQTEDHPVEYGGFEGTIPKGEYGGGTVMVWDRGTWVPEGDPRAQYQKGRLTFELRGKKLGGRWHLVRTRKGGDDTKQSWLLFKSEDERARRRNGSIVEEQPDSALTGRSLEEIAEQADRTWHSKRKERSSSGEGPKKSPKKLGNGASSAGARTPSVTLTHPDRVLYPERGTTKRDLADYYAKVADYILPHVANRPLSLVRCPEGQDKQCFFQKHVGAGVPAPIRAIPIHDKNGDVEYTTVDDVLGLIALVQMSVLEIHTWGSHADDPERPDLLVLDLDPDTALPWRRVAESALVIRERLRQLGLESFVKTTGGKGLHVCAPIRRTLSWDQTKAFCKRIADDLARDEPKSYVATVSKAKRHGKIFVDYLRNGRGATFIAPYSTRARPGAPVATPLAWEELAESRAPAFDIDSVIRRLLRAKDDPWAEINSIEQRVTAKTLRSMGIE